MKWLALGLGMVAASIACLVNYGHPCDGFAFVGLFFVGLYSVCYGLGFFKER